MSIKQNTDRNIQRKRETQIKRRTLAPTISHNIVGNCYTHSETKRDKEIRIKRRTYTSKFIDNIPGHWDRDRERNADQERYLYTYNQWQHSRTLIEAFRQKESEKHYYGYWERNTHQETYIYTCNQTECEKERRIKGRTYTCKITDNIPVHWEEVKKERREIRRSRQVPTQLQSVRI